MTSQTSLQTDPGREFWRGVLHAGGSTTLPRWTLDPVPGVAEHAAAAGPELVAGLRKLAEATALPLGALLLAAHARVLAALSGEGETVTGYVAAPGGVPLPCPLTTADDTWRALLDRAGQVVAGLEAHRDFPVEALRAELGVPGPSFETVLDPTGAGGDLPEGMALRVDLLPQGEGFALRLRYRTDLFDADCAARMAGYHLTALAQLVADPDAEPARQSLLSAEELRFQLTDLAGPRRWRPERRVHELFEERVRIHPDAVAAVHGDREWTYRELNARANQLGRALLARGLQAEDVVAVVTERNLDWMAAVLAVFKAGGAYLPIEPHFPADRIATTLRRAECTLALTETGSTTTLDKALDTLSGVRAIAVDTAYTEGHAEDDLGVPVAGDQLAYLYFTSGSTGEPKGAMCEHAGMVNHLYAKIEDLGIREGEVVAQIAPQCFDISLWQLVSALLVGGRTLILPQDVILDVGRFVDTIVAGRVGVMQVVPSYLEAVLTYLEQEPRPLPDLHCVSATGEALKKELTQRWFAAQPGITLVNAYGLTETCDDTNHEVMHGVPERERVPLGPPIPNVTVMVVDDDLVPVPLGAPGEIVFSGVCVGRGYVNDPERTRRAFVADPHHPGERLYRAGDFGRWLPERKLEFLGRRDTQVKLRGFRIEIGEIENTLLRVPGVRDGAVVVGGTGESAQLVGFYAAEAELPAELLRERLAASLPAYMVPPALHWQPQLPLTANGKIDRKALTALATELGAAAGARAAQDAGDAAELTPTEQRLAEAWAKVLGVPAEQIRRDDHFFDLGGSSLSAVKLAIALERKVSLKDITRHPVLSELATLLDGTGEQAAPARAEERGALLQQLTEHAEPSRGARLLVCFPYAGGNAVNFRPLAAQLRGSGLAVLAVELPGHDLAAEREAFAPPEAVVARVATEIAERSPAGVLLWGHSSGAVTAWATARALQERGIPVERVFLAAQLPRDPAERRAAAAELAGRADADIAAELGATGGYTELGELDAQRAGHVAAAYRHDCIGAHQQLADALEHPPAKRLTAPVTVVVADDDPSTAQAPTRYRGWEALAETVELHRLPDGGHYFLRTRPAEAAAAVLRAARAGSSS